MREEHQDGYALVCDSVLVRVPTISSEELNHEIDEGLVQLGRDLKREEFYQRHPKLRRLVRFF